MTPNAPTSPTLQWISSRYRARLDNKSIEDCPFVSEAACASWTLGWRSADEKMEAKNLKSVKEKVNGKAANQ